MLKIGITQRVDYIENIDETRDVLDQRWTKLLAENNFIILPIPNACNVPNFIDTMKLDGILISGGNDHDTRTICETACIEYCIKHHLPLFGICHGMQFIGQFFGSQLISIKNHVGIYHNVNITVNDYGIPAGNFAVKGTDFSNIKPEQFFKQFIYGEQFFE